MKPLVHVRGTAVPLWVNDVDTDQIMPKQFLKRLERHGYEDYLFYVWRQDPGFVLNDERFRGAKVLVSGPNFGCGSAREHAPWGLQDYGFEAVVAPSFAHNFRSNCAQIGLLLVELPVEACKELADAATADPRLLFEIDVAGQTLRTAGLSLSFELPAHVKHKLVNGLEDLSLTMQMLKEIDAFERGRPDWMPTNDRRGPALRVRPGKEGT